MKKGEGEECLENSFKMKNYFLCDCFCGHLSCPYSLEVPAEHEADEEDGRAVQGSAPLCTDLCWNHT